MVAVAALMLPPTPCSPAYWSIGDETGQPATKGSNCPGGFVCLPVLPSAGLEAYLLTDALPDTTFSLMDGRNVSNTSGSVLDTPGSVPDTLGASGSYGAPGSHGRSWVHFDDPLGAALALVQLVSGDGVFSTSVSRVMQAIQNRGEGVWGGDGGMEALNLLLVLFLAAATSVNFDPEPRNSLRRFTRWSHSFDSDGVWYHVSVFKPDTREIPQTASGGDGARGSGGRLALRGPARREGGTASTHTSYTLHLTPYTLHPSPYTLHPSPYTLHFTPYTLHPTLYTLQPTPYTLLRTAHTHSLHPQVGTGRTRRPTASTLAGDMWAAGDADRGKGWGEPASHATADRLKVRSYGGGGSLEEMEEEDERKQKVAEEAKMKAAMKRMEAVHFSLRALCRHSVSSAWSANTPHLEVTMVRPGGGNAPLPCISSAVHPILGEYTRAPHPANPPHPARVHSPRMLTVVSPWSPRGLPPHFRRSTAVFITDVVWQVRGGVPPRDRGIPTPYALLPTSYTLTPAPYTLHPTPYSLHPQSSTLIRTPHTLHHRLLYHSTLSLRVIKKRREGGVPPRHRGTPTPYALHLTPHTPHPPYTIDCFITQL